MATTVEESPTAGLGWRESAERALRRLSAITLAGALLGLLVGGVGGRLAMMLLARLNPDATGITSDDGFVIGQFTIGNTLQLLLTGTVFGLVGALSRDGNPVARAASIALLAGALAGLLYGVMSRTPADRVAALSDERVAA